MNLLTGEIEAFGGIHYKIGAATFFGVGHLFGEQGLEFLLSHADPSEGSGTLHLRRRRYYHDRVDATVGPGFKQQGDIEDRDGRARMLGLVKKSCLFASDQGVNDSFETL
jgi:hypothetical protein